MPRDDFNKLHARIRRYFTDLDSAKEALGGQGDAYPSDIVIDKVWRNDPDGVPHQTAPRPNGRKSLLDQLDKVRVAQGWGTTPGMDDPEGDP